MFDLSSKRTLLILGAFAGLVAAMLAFFGNPGNMAICVACFIRDTAGSMKFHTAAVVQYFRPEVVGMIGGSFLIAVGTKEYRSTAGSSPMIRFILGIIIMIGALVFLGCPTRMVIRMAAGDLNAYIGLIGFILGVGTGAVALKKGFTLERSYKTTSINGAAITILLSVLLIVSVTTTLFVVSTEGPGSMHAPVLISLIGGLLFGAIAMKSRMCFAGSVRDIFLMKNFDLISVIGGLFVVMLIYNVATGNFHLTMYGNPVAHTESLWNILGMYVVGFAAVLAGGCPLRQLILTGQGSSDAAVTALGMFVGGAVVHNFSLASSADGTTSGGRLMTIVCIIILLAIGFGMKRKRA